MFLALREAEPALHLNGLPRRVQISAATYNRARTWTELRLKALGGGGDRTINVPAKICSYLRQMEVPHKVKCYPRGCDVSQPVSRR
jgi:hypothetical protein